MSIFKLLEKLYTAKSPSNREFSNRFLQICPLLTDNFTNISIFEQLAKLYPAKSPSNRIGIQRAQNCSNERVTVTAYK